MPWRYLSTSLKARLTAVVLSVLTVSMVGGILVPSLFTARALRAQADQDLATRTDALASEVNHWLKSGIATVQLVAKSPDIQSMERARQEPLLRAIRETYPETFLIMTTDVQGMNVGRSDGKKLQAYGDRKYIQQVLAGSPIATEVVVSKTIHKPVVTVATPIRNATNSIVGALVAVTELASVARTVGAVRVGNTGLAYVVDGNNRVVAHSEPRFAEKLEDFSTNLGVQFLRERHGTETEFSLNRDPRSGNTIANTPYLVRVSLLESGWGVVLMKQRQEAYAQVTSFITRALIAIVVALVLVGTLIWLFIARTIRPVEKLTLAASGLAEGRLSERVQVQTRHEIGQLGDAFNRMADAIQKHVSALAKHQAELEETVQRRTSELARRTDEMRIVLDTVDQGLTTLSREGKIGSERSAAFQRWFPASKEHHSLSRLFAAHDELTAKSLEVGWDSLLEGFLPMELNLEQLPKRISVDERQLALTYKPIMDGEEIRSVLLVVTDMTAELKRLAAEAEQREFLNVFERVMKDRSGFIEFFNEATGIAERFVKDTNADAATVQRELHTLKGNCAIFGVTSVADLCHELESRVVEEGIDALRPGLSAIVEQWRRLSSRVVPLIGTESDEIVEVTFSDLDAILTAIQRGDHHTNLAHLVDRLRTEPIEVRFQRLAEQTRALCRRLGRPEPTILVDPGDVRLPREGWGGLFGAFIHLLRNAVDHGLESAEDRKKAHKPERGTLTLRARAVGSDCLIELSDDGRGINWDLVRERATKMNLAHGSRAELTEALFTNGFSTREVASSMSGRGVGMGALREACGALGGSITVESEAGRGTTVKLRVPVRAAPVQGTSLRPAVRVSLRPPTLL